MILFIYWTSDSFVIGSISITGVQENVICNCFPKHLGHSSTSLLKVLQMHILECLSKSYNGYSRVIDYPIIGGLNS